MIFLKETNWRESYIISFQINSNPKVGIKSEKWITEFYLRSYSLDDQREVENGKCEMLLECEVSRRRNNKEE